MDAFTGVHDVYMSPVHGSWQSRRLGEATCTCGDCESTWLESPDVCGSREVSYGPIGAGTAR